MCITTLQYYFAFLPLFIPFWDRPPLRFGFSALNPEIIIIKKLHRARALNLNNDTLSRVFFSQETLGRKLNAKVKAVTPLRRLCKMKRRARNTRPTRVSPIAANLWFSDEKCVRFRRWIDKRHARIYVDVIFNRRSHDYLCSIIAVADIIKIFTRLFRRDDKNVDYIFIYFSIYYSRYAHNKIWHYFDCFYLLYTYTHFHQLLN